MTVAIVTTGALPDFGHSYLYFTQFWVWVRKPVFMLPSKINLKAIISLWPYIPQRPQPSSSSKATFLKLVYAKTDMSRG